MSTIRPSEPSSDPLEHLRSSVIEATMLQLLPSASKLTSASQRWGDNTDDIDPANAMIRKIRETIASFHEPALLLIDGSMDAETRKAVSTGLMFGWSETKVHDCIHLVRVMRANDTYSSSFVELYLQSFDHYRGMATMTDGVYPVERAHQIEAILLVIDHMAKQGIKMEQFGLGEVNWDLTPYIPDERLRTIVVNSGEYRDAVVSIITERNIYDADAIIEMLSTSTPLMTSGAL